jgi:hypothetical protein
MDGRVKFEDLTGLPPGLVTSFRSIGGKNKVGSPLFDAAIREWADFAHRMYRKKLIIATYHFASGNQHRGCAGFSYNTPAAIQYMFQFRDDIESLYKARYVRCVVIGIDTDTGALVMHGADGEILNLKEAYICAREALEMRIEQMFPHLDEEILHTLMLLALKNAQHLRDAQEQVISMVDLEHGERILGLGHGYEWCLPRNLAINIGPFDPDLEFPLLTAAGLIQANIRERRISQADGGVFLVCIPYRKKIDRDPAVRQALYFAELARGILEKVPRNEIDMSEFLSPLVCVLDYNTPQLEVIHGM